MFDLRALRRRRRRHDVFFRLQAASGVAAKRINSPYSPAAIAAAPGSRRRRSIDSNSSLLAGPTQKARARRSALLGYYDDAGKLIYAGRVGTGMMQGELAAWSKMLALLQ